MVNMLQSGSRAPKRALTPLSPNANKYLIGYSLAAAAAGVSIAAAATPAEAEIIYTPKAGSFSSGHLLIDLDQNGSADFDLAIHTQHFTSFFGSYQLGRLNIGAESANGSVIASNGSAAALMSGGVIGSARNFRNVHDRRGHMFQIRSGRTFSSGVSFRYATGNWNHTTNRFLGMRFQINGETHYGWLRLSVQQRGRYTIVATINGFAYETTPNQSLLAGQTVEGQNRHAVNVSGSLAQMARGTTDASHLPK